MAYKRGWLPSEPNFIKNFVSFHNQEGAKFHITGDITFENALFADNYIGVRYGAWNQGTTFENSVFMLSEPKKGYTGIIATFNNKPWFHKNIVLRNFIFRNYATSTTIKFYDHNLMEEDMGDPIHAYNVTMENCDDNSIPKLSECGPRYQNFFIEDFDGTLGPTAMGPGFFIRANDRVKVFLPERSCAAMTNGDEERRPGSRLPCGGRGVRRTPLQRLCYRGGFCVPQRPPTDRCSNYITPNRNSNSRTDGCSIHITPYRNPNSRTYKTL
jgi:hypothetical protein